MINWPECPYPGCSKEAVYTNGNADAITCKQHSWCPADMLEITDAHVLKMGKNIIVKEPDKRRDVEPCELCYTYSRCWVDIGSGRDKRTVCDRCTDKINDAWCR